jgi:type II restriction/modification system DNA methylase subunit YeeA
MTPHAFVHKWRPAALKESTGSQTHFNDLCALLDIPDPATADPTGEWFAFEKGATKTTGGNGWADVWRKGCFAWEYKGPGKNLDAAHRQLLQYAVALENPPLLIVSDMDRIIVRTNFTNSVQETHAFTLDDLLDGARRDRLKAAFTDPEQFRPAKTRQRLTEEVAAEFAALAQRLRGRGRDADAVAHFVNRLVFCMFAEDVGLLPEQLFSRLLDVSRASPGEFEPNARALFGAMAHAGGKVGFTRIDWFNGGLFDDDAVLPLDADDLATLTAAARQDWSQIDPSILGTLFERGLDPDKRSQLGAHYTDRDKIMLIVKPVIVEPLEAEWAQALAKITALIENAPRETREKLLRGAELAKRTKALAEATAVHSAFVERLAAFRVLDPACGSGNFLYVALKALKDIEHRANLDAEALGLPRGFPRTGPENVLGIEINPYAAELARVSVWIGEIQWMRRNGFDAARNPILRPLDTIECRDAVLSADGTRAEWPVADAVIGNPPFLGNKKLIRELGEDYTLALRQAWPEVPGGVDLVCYWFAMAWAMIIAGRAQRAGLVATNSIRGGANRKVLKPIVEHGHIFNAWGDEEWTVEGAAVRVSLLSFAPGEGYAKPTLDGRSVHRISAALTSIIGNVDLTLADDMQANAAVAYQGTIKTGPFEVAGDLARAWIGLPLNPNGQSNARVLRPWKNGEDIVRGAADYWIVDFGTTMSLTDAALYEVPFAHLSAAYQAENAARAVAGKPLLRGRELRALDDWWLHQRPRPKLRKALALFARFILTPRVSKHRIFIWVDQSVLPDSATVAIARDDDTSFGILHSRFHELWSLRMGTSLEDRPRYTPSTTFETFPFPEGLTPDIPAADYADDPRAKAIAAAAARLNELRENWLNPADLVVRVPEVVPGYPDRILPKDEAAANVLKTRTLTNLYNQRPQWLANAHAALDEAVADAYGWGDDWRAGKLDDDAILARLFRLNQQRAKA